MRNALYWAVNGTLGVLSSSFGRIHIIYFVYRQLYVAAVVICDNSLRMQMVYQPSGKIPDTREAVEEDTI
jgi:hypothetical protein